MLTNLEMVKLSERGDADGRPLQLVEFGTYHVIGDVGAQIPAPDDSNLNFDPSLVHLIDTASQTRKENKKY